MKPIFTEKQRFTQWWIWLIFIVIGLFTGYGVYKQLVLQEPFGNNPMSNIGLLIFSGFILGIILLFFIMQLKTTINEQGITMHFRPFTRKQIAWEEITKLEVLDYGFVGGWGIRLWTNYGTVYNIKGSKGLALELKDGKKLLIGTQTPEALAATVKAYIAK